MRYDENDDFTPEEDEDTHSEGDPQTEADVTCPYCGESVRIELDASGGAVQDYVEDCQVCCRPWKVRVEYDENGSANVTVEEAQ
jgi:hypothetical protein